MEKRAKFGGRVGGKEKDAETRRSALDGRVKAFAGGEGRSTDPLLLTRLISL